MSDIAIDIENALDEGLYYEEIIDMLVKQYTMLTPSDARQMIDGVVRIIDECERAAEIAAEARFN
ncbi:hypothetical protein EBT25_10480 [bacterium]|nr:hypothetical protein [bacterium]